MIIIQNDNNILRIEKNNFDIGKYDISYTNGNILTTQTYEKEHLLLLAVQLAAEFDAQFIIGDPKQEKSWHVGDWPEEKTLEDLDDSTEN